LPMNPNPNQPGGPGNPQPIGLSMHQPGMNPGGPQPINNPMGMTQGQPLGMSASMPPGMGNMPPGHGPQPMQGGMQTMSPVMPQNQSIPLGHQVSISHSMMPMGPGQVQPSMHPGQPGMHPGQPMNMHPSQPTGPSMMNMPQNSIPRPGMAQAPRVSPSPSIMGPSGSIPGSPISVPVQSTSQIVNSKPITPQMHGNTSLPTDKHVISREKLQELVQMFDSTERLDPEAEDLLLLVADEFVDSVTEFACKLAKHRKSNTLEARDLELHLEKAWNIKIPGFCTSTPTADSIPVRRPNLMTSSHQQRLMDIKKTKK